MTTTLLQHGRLKQVLRQKLISQTRLAETIGRSKQTVNRATRIMPSNETARLICDYLGVGPETLWPDECSLPTSAPLVPAGDAPHVDCDVADTEADAGRAFRDAPASAAEGGDHV